MQEQLKQIMDSIGKVEFKKSLPSSLLSKLFGDMSESEKRLVMAEQSLSQDEIAVMVVDDTFSEYECNKCVREAYEKTREKGKGGTKKFKYKKP